MKFPLLIACSALCLAALPSAHAQLAGSSVDPTTVSLSESGNGYYFDDPFNGPGVSAIAIPGHAETETVIYGFQVTYNGPGPAPSTTTINISGLAGGAVFAGDLGQAEAEIGALADLGGVAGLSGTPQVIVNAIADTTTRSVSDPFSQNYDVYVGQSYAVQLYVNADITAGIANAVLDPDVTLGMNVPDGADYSITLTPGVLQGPFVPGSAPDTASTAGLLALGVAGLFAVGANKPKLARFRSR